MPSVSIPYSLKERLKYIDNESQTSFVIEVSPGLKGGREGVVECCVTAFGVREH